MTQKLTPIGHRGDYDTYRIVGGSGVKNVAGVDILRGYGEDTNLIDEIADPTQVRFNTVTVGKSEFQYAAWGDDDQLPFTLLTLLKKNMVTSQCMLFNIISCYGQGVRIVDRKTLKKADDKDIRDFCMRNNLHELFLRQATDMQHFSLMFTLLTLSRDGSRIVGMNHREACYCRFEKADRYGRIRHVVYGNWRNGQPEKPIAYALLDLRNPLDDLLIRMGKKPDPKTGQLRPPTGTRSFCVVSRMPTPAYQYYPIPYYASMFCDQWYDMYRAIGVGKLAMIKNTSAPRVQIEIHRDYFMNVFMDENITDLGEQKKRRDELEQEIIDYVCGAENAGKGLITYYFVDPNGKENRMVRITNLNEGSRKEGGDWADDMQEASNVLCFCMGVHPNLVGATPGKSQMNNSGSDKRELFTLKQATMIPFHDVMAKPYHVVLHYNGWSDKYGIDVPMIQLTTLDKNKDAQEVIPTKEAQ